MAIVAAIAVLVTAATHPALPVRASTPNARATCDMELPASEIVRPVKNHRKGTERSGREPSWPVPATDCSSLAAGPVSRPPDAAILGTCCHNASTTGMFQLRAKDRCPNNRDETMSRRFPVSSPDAGATGCAPEFLVSAVVTAGAARRGAVAAMICRVTAQPISSSAQKRRGFVHHFE
ncbi:hypothetical protein GCM10020218_062100 [Dactylosporangium vinaceum]|uniref:Secreted protein n=1 Tax=Dactylosporangium vinaceum TaxID=53362 RepID=A0ABV5M9C8_9ACTN|nr:hypothetical protein [Dactylosporangium vinaceum]